MLGKERLMLKKWGVSWNSQMQYASDYMCKCRTRSDTLLERMDLLVGFDTGGPLSKKGSSVQGVGIFQCNVCYEYFWYHFTQNVVDFIKNHTTKWNPGN